MIKKVVKKIAKKIINSLPSSIVLMLHQVTDGVNGELCYSITESNLDSFTSRFENWASLEDVAIKKVRHKIALTFDDGFDDIYGRVYPICKRKNIPFTVFVTYSLLNTPGYLTKEHLVKLSNDPLVTIGSHNIRHLPLPTLSKEEQKLEIVNSKKLLEELINKPVIFLAYPYGRNDKNTIKILKKEKLYSRAFISTGIALNLYSMLTPYALPRINLSNITIDACSSEIERLTVKRTR